MIEGINAGALVASESRSKSVKTHDEILARIRGLTTGIRDVMWVVDHQASAPSVRCVCLADFAHHFETSLEAKAITSEPRRYENADTHSLLQNRRGKPFGTYDPLGRR
jgi:hypothetical protein